jgi:hypothetical protein
MNELQSSATDLPTTSKFYKNNVIQAGKASLRARLADGTEPSEPSARQVSDDTPCDDPIVESIVADSATNAISAWT